MGDLAARGHFSTWVQPAVCQRRCDSPGPPHNEAHWVRADKMACSTLLGRSPPRGPQASGRVSTRRWVRDRGRLPRRGQARDDVFRHDVFRGVVSGAEISRCRRGSAALKSQSRSSRSSAAVTRLFPRSRSDRTSSTAQARTYNSSWRASSSDLAITNSPSESSNSRAR